ncbi:MAG: hypothetical protein WBB02_14125, partial [Saprospiraceae bacterium]
QIDSLQESQQSAYTNHLRSQFAFTIPFSIDFAVQLNNHISPILAVFPLYLHLTTIIEDFYFRHDS